MRRLLLFAAALATAACGSMPAIDEEAAPFVATALRQANENWLNGLRTGSPALLEPLLSSDATITFPDGTTATKASLLEDLRSGRLKFDSVAGEQSRTRILVRTAIVTGTATMHLQRDSLPGAERVRYTALYAWTGNRWVMEAWQGTRRTD